MSWIYVYLLLTSMIIDGFRNEICINHRINLYDFIQNEIDQAFQPNCYEFYKGRLSPNIVDELCHLDSRPVNENFLTLHNACTKFSAVVLRRPFFCKHKIPANIDELSLFSREYNIKQDFFTFNFAWVNKMFSEFAWKNNNLKLKILEVGAFEGLMTCWMLDNIADNPDTRIYSVDLFGVLENYDLHDKEAYEYDYKERFDANIKATGRDNQVIALQGKSEEILPSMIADHKGTFDLAIIDGNHKALNVLTDTLNAFYLLKVGGIFIFDDYSLIRGEETPRIGIDSFMLTVNFRKTRVKVLRKEFQGYFIKVSD